MADVNASERGQVGYEEAKATLTSMIAEKTVYLDVDDPTYGITEEQKKE